MRKYKRIGSTDFFIFGEFRLAGSYSVESDNTQSSVPGVVDTKSYSIGFNFTPGVASRMRSVSIVYWT
jgi:hypothetical protein